jgi:hypothetical protein
MLVLAEPIGPAGKEADRCGLSLCANQIDTNVQ